MGKNFWPAKLPLNQKTDICMVIDLPPWSLLLLQSEVKSTLTGLTIMNSMLQKLNYFRTSKGPAVKIDYFLKEI